MPFIEVTPEILAEKGVKYSLQSVDALEEEIRQSLLKILSRGAKNPLVRFEPHFLQKNIQLNL